MSHKRYTPEQELVITKLRAEGVSIPALITQFGGTLTSMRGCLRRHGVKPLPTGRPRWRDFTHEQVEDMLVRWKSGESQHAIAMSYGTTQDIVSRLLQRHGFQYERRLNSRSGENHGMWRGGRIILSGYAAVRITPDSPFLSMAHGGMYVLEHRLVMAQHLGRCLLPNETCHHIDGDRMNNRIENLQLLQRKHGSGVAYCCGDCGSQNIVEATIVERCQERST